MRIRIGFGAVLLALVASLGPVSAADATLAPADEYFGRFNLSVLGIANSIRDSGARIDAGAEPRDLFTGPLAFATDAIHAWETRYPSDPWIPRDLLALETVYLKVPTDDAFKMAARTAAWLLADFPSSPYVTRAKQMLAAASSSAAPVGGPWERFASLRAPLPPR